RETDDPVEQEGVRRARARAAEADLVLWLSDAEQDSNAQDVGAPVWMVRNKIDRDAVAAPSRHGQSEGDFRISASRGDGISELIAGLVGFAQDYFGSIDDGLIGRERQREL